MFFKQIAKVKKPAKLYLSATAAGARAGGVLGAEFSLLVTAPVLFEGFIGSTAKTTTGKIADGMEDVAKVWSKSVGFGLFVGAAPVTYPLSKMYEHIKASQKSTENDERQSQCKLP